MSTRLLKAFGLAGLAGAVLLIAPAPARASLQFTMTITSGGASASYDFATATPTFSGAAAGTFSSMSLGGVTEIDFTGIVNGLVFILRSTDTNSPGTPTLASLDISGGNISNGNVGATSFSVDVLADSYTQPASPPNLNFSSTASGSVLTGTLTNANFTVTAGAFTSTNNVANGTGITGPASASTGTASQVITLNVPPSYTMTAQYTGTLSAGARTTSLGGLGTITPAPEPSTLVALAAGAPVIGLGRWLRRRKVASA